MEVSIRYADNNGQIAQRLLCNGQIEAPSIHTYINSLEGLTPVIPSSF